MVTGDQRIVPAQPAAGRVLDERSASRFCSNVAFILISYVASE